MLWPVHCPNAALRAAMKIGNRPRTGALGMCVSPEKQTSPLRIVAVLVACARSVMFRRHAVAHVEPLTKVAKQLADSPLSFRAMRVARGPATRLSISRFALMVVGLVGPALVLSACTSGTESGTAPNATRCGEPGVSFACGAETCSDALPVCCLYSNRPSRCVPTGSICTRTQSRSARKAK